MAKIKNIKSKKIVIIPIIALVFLACFLTYSFANFKTIKNFNIIGQLFYGNEYTLFYDVASCSSKTIKNGKEYGELCDPNVPGYTFNGWLKGGSPVSVSDIVRTNTDVSLDASLTPNNYTLSFEPNDFVQIFELSALNITYTRSDDDVYTFTTTKAYDGLYFPNGWFDVGTTYTLKYKIRKISGNLLNIRGHSAAAGDPIFKLDGVVQSDKYHEAAQNVADDTNTHTVELTFTYTGTAPDNNIYIQPNRGSTTPVTVELFDVKLIKASNFDSKSVTYNDDMPSPVAVPTKTGYTFTGWYDQDDGGKQYYNANGVTSLKYDIPSDATLYGNWNPNTYRVFLHTDGGVINSSNALTWSYGTAANNVSYGYKDHLYGTKYSAFPTPTKAGYTFNGWYQRKNLTPFTVEARNIGYNYVSLLNNVMPGITYNIKYEVALTSGSTSKFSISLFDFTDNVRLIDTQNDFGLKNAIITTPADLNPNHDNQILIYAGIYGQTQNIGLSVTYLSISGGVYSENSNIPIGDDYLQAASNHQFFASWTQN